MVVISSIWFLMIIVNKIILHSAYISIFILLVYLYLRVLAYGYKQTVHSFIFLSNYFPSFYSFLHLLLAYQLYVLSTLLLCSFISFFILIMISYLITQWSKLIPTLSDSSHWLPTPISINHPSHSAPSKSNTHTNLEVFLYHLFVAYQNRLNFRNESLVQKFMIHL